MAKKRIPCIYPMNEFYNFEDEVPKNARVSTPEDCEKCDNECDLKHCLMVEHKSKVCFNHCPKCDATDPDIKWGEKDWFDNQAYQSATCLKCGCEFKEYYTYTDTEIDGEN
jgi:hypothetical protein